MGTYTSDQESNSVLTNGNSHNDASFIHNKENGKDDGEYYDGSSPSGQSPQYDTHGTSSDSVKEVFSIDRIDPVLQRKMALVNESIDSIRMTAYQWEMFVLNGFGYAVDSLLVVAHSIANPAVQQEYGNPSKHVSGIALASQVGLLVGAGIWGSADIIGRKLAFNTNLLSCAIFVLIAGAMPDYISFATF